MRKKMGKKSWMHKLGKKNWEMEKWYFTCCLMVFAFFLTACSTTNTDNMNAGGTAHENSVSGEGNPSRADAQEPEWVYMPEFLKVEDTRANYGKMQLIDDTVCYISRNGESSEEEDRIGQYSLIDRKLTVASIHWPLKEQNLDVSSYVFNPDYSVWLIVNAYPADYSHLKRYLCKFDSEGKNLITREITEQLTGDISLGPMAVDSQGRLYVFSGEYTEKTGIWLFDADGTFRGSITAPSSGSASAEESVLTKGTLEGEDGSFYVCIVKGVNPEHSSLMELDFEHCRLTEVTENFPNVNGFCAWKRPAGVTAGSEAISSRADSSSAESDQPANDSITGTDEITSAHGTLDTDDIASAHGTFEADDMTSTDSPARTYEYLTWDNTAVYGYNLSTQKSGATAELVELFRWADSDINGYFVTNFGRLTDGRYLCIAEDWEHDDVGLVLLTRTRSEEVPQQSRLTLAAVDSGSDLTAMAVKFNRNHAQYHLTVKNYASLTDLYNALLAKENIDIIDLSSINVEALAGQGVFEDLTPYVDRSTVFDGSDFVDGILDVYTFDGALTGIPETFWLRTVAGDGARLVNDAGLSLEELLAIAARNPNILLFDGVTREELMQYIMLFNEEAFIDQDTGQCQFDTDTFQAVLELCRRLPESSTGNGQNGGSGNGTGSGPNSGGPGRSEEDTLADRIQNGQVLFSVEDMISLNHFQPCQELFGENAACVGFPTMDGKGGTLLFPRNAFGIAAGSENKEAAWTFVEGILNQDTQKYVEEFFPYYSSLKKNLNARAERMIQSTLAADKYPTRIYDDGWTFQYHRLTWEEVHVILDLVKGARPAFVLDNDPVLQIINEEASGYYNGQKNVEDVIKVIQNRVQLYMDEQRK